MIWVSPISENYGKKQKFIKQEWFFMLRERKEDLSTIMRLCFYKRENRETSFYK